MASWGLLFDRRGHLQDEFESSFKRSWGINMVGQCRFTLPINDPKNTLQNFEFGMHLVVMNDEGLPPWSGRLETPRVWGNKTNKHYAESHAKYWQDRIGEYTIPYGLLQPAGTIIKRIIRIANMREDTLLRPGDIFTGGKKCGTVISADQYLAENVEQIIKQSGHEYEIVPVVNNNRLILYLNWQSQLGIETGVSLNDSNSRIEENSLSENGPIKSLILGTGKVNEIKNHHLAIDHASWQRYGLREMPLEVDAVEAVAVKVMTEQQLDELADPSRTFRATASNVDGLYQLLRLGNRVQFESVESGYGKRGIIGTQAAVRILGMACADEVDGAALTIAIPGE
jgi:hypothetical protein